MESIIFANSVRRLDGNHSLPAHRVLGSTENEISTSGHPYIGGDLALNLLYCIVHLYGSLVGTTCSSTAVYLTTRNDGSHKRP